MTKLRAPLSLDTALARIAGLVGWDAMGRAVGHSASFVRKWGDIDSGKRIPLACAIALDKSYQVGGGDGAPILEFYLSEIDAAGLGPATGAALSRAAVAAIKESAEANAALVELAQSGNDPALRRKAVSEVDEAQAAFHHARSLAEGAARDTHPSTGPPLPH
jgi:fructose-specific component phosphotransferase system IIB-like protein